MKVLKKKISQTPKKHIKMSASEKKNVLPEIYSSNVFMEQLKQTFLGSEEPLSKSWIEASYLQEWD